MIPEARGCVKRPLVGARGEVRLQGDGTGSTGAPIDTDLRGEKGRQISKIYRPPAADFRMRIALAFCYIEPGPDDGPLECGPLDYGLLECGPLECSPEA